MRQQWSYCSLAQSHLSEIMADNIIHHQLHISNTSRTASCCSTWPDHAYEINSRTKNIACSNRHSELSRKSISSSSSSVKDGGLVRLLSYVLSSSWENCGLPSTHCANLDRERKTRCISGGRIKRNRVIKAAFEQVKIILLMTLVTAYLCGVHSKDNIIRCLPLWWVYSTDWWLNAIVQ